MSLSPAPAQRKSSPAPIAGAPAREPARRAPARPAPVGRLTGAWIGIAAGAGTLVVLALAYVAPARAALLIPALVLVLAVGYLAVDRVRLRRMVVDRDQLAI